jgi:tripartite-type tricarboxylate transporter receptor subunit TctC
MERILIAILSTLVFLGGVSLESGILAAEKYPVKPITLILPMGPGADVEQVLRPWVQKVSDLLGKPILFVHKPGAGGTISAREIYAAKPDGYTIGAMVGSMLIFKMRGLLPYDHHDYTLINTVASMSPVIIASKKTKRPFKTIEEVMAFAKSNPGEVTIASTSVGSTFWIGAIYFQERIGLKFNIIPQEEGAGQAVAQVAGGHVDIGIVGLPSAKPQIDAGNLRLLATIGEQRSYEPYNYAPTLREVGQDIVFRGGASAIIGPPKIPKEIVDKLADTFQTALDPQIQKHLLACDQIPFFLRSEEAYKRLDAERDVMRSVLDKAGLLKEK